MANEPLTAARLREVIHYAPDTGMFTRKVRLAQRHQAGDRADTEISTSPMRGYRRVSLFGQRSLANRLAWFYGYGAWPEKHIDHINGDKGDNRISNLREADNRINMENMRKAKSSNKVGLLGVHLHKQSGRWRARIEVRGKCLHIGLYDTPEIAHQQYLKAKRSLHEGCTI